VVDFVLIVVFFNVMSTFFSASWYLALLIF